MRLLVWGLQSLASLLGIACLVVASNTAQAVTRTFIIDSNLSTLTASGNLYGETYQAQGAGSLATKFTGSLVLDLIPDTLGGGTVQFLSGSVIDANTNGNWQPQVGQFGGTAPADYGAYTDDVDAGSGAPLKYYLATRNLTAELTSSPIYVGSNFDVGGVTMTFTGGTTDWSLLANGSPYLNGSQPLTSTPAANASANGSFNPSSITLPINISFPVDGNGNGTIDSLFALTGQLVATISPRSYGDFDGDSDVDGADFVAWQTQFPIYQGPVTADADGDGDVDGADFVVWQTNFPFTAFGNSSGVAPVPEPASVGLALAGVLGFVVCKRRLYASRAVARGL